MLGTIALILGAVALGLSTVPLIFYDEPLPLLGDQRKEKEIKHNVDVKVTVNRFDFTWRRKKDDAEPAADAPAPIDHSQVMARRFKFGSVSVALVGMVVGTFARLRERRAVLSITALVLCSLALVWQYAIVGIVIGIAVAVFLIVISHLG